MPRHAGLSASVCLGRLKCSELPVVLDVWCIEKSFDDLRRRTAASGVEWGSCMVWEGGLLKLVHEASGWRYGVSPLCKPADHDCYVGFAHVHLPDPVSGRAYPGFSAFDFRGALVDGDRLALVANSGDEAFALVRTSDATWPARPVPEEEFRLWQKWFEEALGAAGAEIERAAWQINRRLCDRLGFAFYYGRWGEPLNLVFRPLGR